VPAVTHRPRHHGRHQEEDAEPQGGDQRAHRQATQPNHFFLKDQS